MVLLHLRIGESRLLGNNYEWGRHQYHQEGSMRAQGHHCMCAADMCQGVVPLGLYLVKRFWVCVVKVGVV